MLKILVVDDNRSSADAMTRVLSKQGHQVTPAYDGATAIRLLHSEEFVLVLTDLKMEPVDGMAVLRAARTLPEPVEVIVFTAFGAVEHAVEAMQLGARDFLTKPVSVDQILARLRQITGEELPTIDTSGEMVTESNVAKALVHTLQAIADVPSPVWIEGEIGSGREQAAFRMHAFMEDETPIAVVDPTSQNAWPESGVVVLPDVDTLADAAQAGLLRRIKSSDGLRFVATAQPGGRQAVSNGSLRADLFFALAVVVVQMPPLRERTEDIVPMFIEALERFCGKYQRDVPELDDAQVATLKSHRWPGNVRELLNLAESMAVLGHAGFGLDDQAPVVAAGGPTLGPDFRLADYLEKIERSVLEEALNQAGGDRNAAGRLLGVERNTLRYKLNKYGLLRR